MRTSEAFDLAADLIERDGWYSMHHGGSGTGNCVSNAIAAIVPEYHVQKVFFTHLGGFSLSDIWRWNDAPERTAAEVIEVLRACALIESAREEQDAAWQTYAGLVTV